MAPDDAPAPPFRPIRLTIIGGPTTPELRHGLSASGIDLPMYFRVRHATRSEPWIVNIYATEETRASRTRSRRTLTWIAATSPFETDRRVRVRITYRPPRDADGTGRGTIETLPPLVTVAPPEPTVSAATDTETAP